MIILRLIEIPCECHQAVYTLIIGLWTSSEESGQGKSDEHLFELGHHYNSVPWLLATLSV